jgi:flavin-dependent dehydrogenase
MNTDIVVVGSGIAASAALLTLKQQGFSAIQIAPSEKATERIGETLSCSANRILKELKLWDAFRDRGYLVNDLVFSAWETPSLTRQSRLSTIEGSNWSIDRRDFEDFLRHQVDSSHHRRLFNKVQNCHFVENSLELELDNQQALRAQFVIDCSGRASVIGGRLTKRYRIDNMICYYSFIKQTDHEIEPTVGLMIEAVENGWWYSAILPDNRMIISFYTYPDLVHAQPHRDIQAWDILIKQAPLTRQRIESAGYAVLEPSLTIDAGMIHQADLSGEHWCAAGDALGTLDPLSSHGMTQALWSGRRVAEACSRALRGDDSGLGQLKQTMHQAMQAYQTELLQKYRSVHRFTEHPFWQRRGSLNFQTETTPEKAGT